MENFKQWRIVFMGTPTFAVASLAALVESGCNVVGVITAPDKPAGRGMQLQESAVKSYAVAHQIPVLQPEKLKDPSFLEALRNLQADVQIVVAFRMLPEVVWNMPPMGTINVHGSLLPQYRGAAPINWAIINGEASTGVTTFKLKHEIDTGDILASTAIPIPPDMNAGALHDTMMEVGAQLLLQTLQGLAAGTLQEQPQPMQDGSLQHAPKIFTATCEINWAVPAQQVYNLIRGLSPYPAAFSALEGKKLKVYEAAIVAATSIPAPGTIATDGKTYLHFAAADGWISIQQLQLEGKKKMGIEEFLRGYRWQQIPA